MKHLELVLEIVEAAVKGDSATTINQLGYLRHLLIRDGKHKQAQMVDATVRELTKPTPPPPPPARLRKHL